MRKYADLSATRADSRRAWITPTTLHHRKNSAQAHSLLNEQFVEPNRNKYFDCLIVLHQHSRRRRASHRQSSSNEIEKIARENWIGLQNRFEAELGNLPVIAAGDQICAQSEWNRCVTWAWFESLEAHCSIARCMPLLVLLLQFNYEIDLGSTSHAASQTNWIIEGKT